MAQRALEQATLTFVTFLHANSASGVEAHLQIQTVSTPSLKDYIAASRVAHGASLVQNHLWHADSMDDTFKDAQRSFVVPALRATAIRCESLIIR